ncbi:hypothetical protein F5J12DRAFT_905105 [Pisolithus orientalis]|uniref:uncharacterized protein n=1 Tax=Pisolithus orientalis TaxID=936130 RepID=UPI002224F54E|nr:uncharacterized protein F5J12DRAFT_905105 [Pisolithus orientalis]KAI6009629.1 hypothetical protein F5J12DRAFT_905105 [Pisolithus orientalis]
MGFDMETFDDTSTHGDPHPQCQSLDAAGALGLVLHHLNLTMTEISLQQIFAIIPSTASQYTVAHKIVPIHCITFGLQILLSTLCNMPKAQIHWPQPREFEKLSELCIFNIQITMPTQTDTYKGLIIGANINAPGTADIVGWICTPLKEELLSYQQTAEWGMQAIQGSFGRLQVPLNINDEAKHGNLIETWLRLHNHWQETKEDIEVWMGFRDMLFPDQVRKD